MRVAIVANPHFTVPPKTYGGTENVIFYLIKGLLELGHEPILLGPQDCQVDCELIPTVAKALPYPKRKVYYPSYQKWLKVVEKRTARELHKLLPRIDVVHSHGFDLEAFQNFPNITTLHNKIEFEDMEYFIKRKDFPFVSISKNQQGSLPILNYISVVYDGMDPEEFPIIEKPDDYLCFVGRFEREKGPHLAIQLALSLGIKIKLAGKLDFHGTSYFNEEIKQYLKHPLVEYLGAIPHTEKIELVSQALCNLHPIQWREPFGLTVIEPGYCGTPTLAHRRGSLSEVIQEGKTGMLVEDFIEGYYVLEKCLALDRKTVAQKVRKRFNYRRMTRGYLRAYRRVIKEYKKK